MAYIYNPLLKEDLQKTFPESDPLSLHLDQTTPQSVTGGTPSFVDIKFPSRSLGTPTYSTIRDYMDSFGSTGRKTGGVITDATGGYVAVTAGTGFIKASDDDNAQLMFFDWAAPTNIAIPANSTRYIGVEYNGGIPQVVARTTFNWNLDTEFPLGRVISESLNGAQELYIYNSPWWVTDGITNTIEVIRSFGLVRRDETIGGLILSSTGTRNVAVTSGTLWSGLNEFNFAGLDTAVTGTFEYYWYKSGTGWQISDATQFSVTQWNDITQTTLQTIDLNKYCNIWVYGEFDAGVPNVALIYPQAQYNTAAAAEAKSAPDNLPTHIKDVGKLLGRIIIKQGVDAPVSVQTVFTSTFANSVVTDHGNLSGLSDDDHTQYLLVDGTRALAGNLSLGGYNLTNGGSITGTTFTDGTLTITGGAVTAGVSSVFGNITQSGSLISHSASVAANLIIKNTDVSKSVLINVMSSIGVDFTIANFLGQYASVALGLSASATGVGSMALGNTANASYASAIAIGNNTISSADASVAIGYQNTASGANSVCIGSKPEKGSCAASNTNATAIGYAVLASGSGSVAIGNTCTASSTNSLALGKSAAATNNTGAMAIGLTITNTTANSLALGISGIDLLITSGTANFQDTIITTTGDLRLVSDANRLEIGAGIDLILYHDGTNSFIYNDTGILKIQDAGSGIWIGTASTELLSFYGGTAVNRPDALTAQLTSITHTAPGTPDYALQDLVQNTGFGFATQDEGNTLLSVVLNLQTRVAELEARLEELNLITPN